MLIVDALIVDILMMICNYFYFVSGNNVDSLSGAEFQSLFQAFNREPMLHQPQAAAVLVGEGIAR